jgi:hypothetical protein
VTGSGSLHRLVSREFAARQPPMRGPRCPRCLFPPFFLNLDLPPADFELTNEVRSTQPPLLPLTHALLRVVCSTRAETLRGRCFRACAGGQVVRGVHSRGARGRVRGERAAAVVGPAAAHRLSRHRASALTLSRHLASALTLSRHLASALTLSRHLASALTRRTAPRHATLGWRTPPSRPQPGRA